MSVSPMGYFIAETPRPKIIYPKYHCNSIYSCQCIFNSTCHIRNV